MILSLQLGKEVC